MDTKKFEYFCSRAAAGIGILILGFLSLYSLFYTEEFTANRTEELELVHDPVVLSLLSIAVILVLLFYAAKIILKNEAIESVISGYFWSLPAPISESSALSGLFYAIII